jgi:hypothetical protein
MRLLGDDGTAPAALRLERFRWRTVASAVALTVAAYLLIGEVSGVDVLGTLARPILAGSPSRCSHRR